MSTSSSFRPSILILSDSHGKNLDSTIITTFYEIKSYSISGLQWINKYNKSLCLFSLIQQDPFSSLMCSTSYVLFLLGTNSLRNWSATEVIVQVDHIIAFLYSRYNHLTNNRIIITACIPCLKPSKRFSTTLLLNANIDHYNQLLLSLATAKCFSCFTLPVSLEWLGADLMHIDYQYRGDFVNIILRYINDLNVNRNLPSRAKNRSLQSITHRNRKRNMKLRRIQQNFTLTREISADWSYQRLKQFLQLKGVKYARLSIVPYNQLHIFFNNFYHMHNAEQALPLNIITFPQFF